MLNKRARKMIGYDRLVKELVAKVEVKELDELETDHLKAMLGEGYEKWEFKDWYRLLGDIKRTIRIAAHEILTAEAVFNSIPWAAKKRWAEFERYPKYKEAYIRAFDKMLIERKRRGLKIMEGWRTGKKVFKWWMEDDSCDGQMRMDEWGNIYEEYA